MKRSCYRLSVDLHGSYGACQPEVKQGDTHRSLLITLTDGGMPYEIGAACTPVFICKKPDGTVLYNFCRVENNTIIYDYTPQTTAVAGLLDCELRLYNAPRQVLTDDTGALTLEGEQVELLTSVTFGIRVLPSVYNGNEIPESAGEVTALEQLVAEGAGLLRALSQARLDGEFDGPPGPKGDPGEADPVLLQKLTRLDTVLGDIDTALDAILAIQEELLGTVTFTVNDSYEDHTFTVTNGTTWGDFIRGHGFLCPDCEGSVPMGISADYNEIVGVCADCGTTWVMEDMGEAVFSDTPIRSTRYYLA